MQVALGWGHALALTAEGHVYSWGYAAHGRLGFQPHGTPSPSTCKDGILSEDMEMLDVLAAMEKEKSAALSWEPVRVDALQSHHVTQISCGLDHSLTLNGNHTTLSPFSYLLVHLIFLPPSEILFPTFKTSRCLMSHSHLLPFCFAHSTWYHVILASCLR